MYIDYIYVYCIDIQVLTYSMVRILIIYDVYVYCIDISVYYMFYDVYIDYICILHSYIGTFHIL